MFHLADISLFSSLDRPNIFITNATFNDVEKAIKEYQDYIASDRFNKNDMGAEDREGKLDQLIQRLYDQLNAKLSSKKREVIDLRRNNALGQPESQDEGGDMSMGGDMNMGGGEGGEEGGENFDFSSMFGGEGEGDDSLDLGGGKEEGGQEGNKDNNKKK